MVRFDHTVGPFAQEKWDPVGPVWPPFLPCRAEGIRDYYCKCLIALENLEISRGGAAPPFYGSLFDPRWGEFSRRGGGYLAGPFRL